MGERETTGRRGASEEGQPRPQPTWGGQRNGGKPSDFDLERYTAHVADVVTRLDRTHPGQAIPLAMLAQAAPAPRGALASALKSLAGRRVVIVKATENGIQVRPRPSDPEQPGALPAYDPGTREWRVARWLVRRGQRPTEAAVAERLRAIEAARRSEERRARWRAELETEAPVVVAYVREIRTKASTGPTWAEVGTHMHWKYAEGNFKLSRLVAMRVVFATRQARSLDVPPTPDSASAIDRPGTFRALRTMANEDLGNSA